jgi:hypothetical protein
LDKKKRAGSTACLNKSEASFHASEDSELSSETEDFDEDDLDEDDDAEILGDQSFSDILARYGLDYKQLLTNVTKKNENGVLTKYKSPLTPSLFLNVPPTINFATQDEKSILIFYHNCLKFFEIFSFLSW